MKKILMTSLALGLSFSLAQAASETATTTTTTTTAGTPTDPQIANVVMTANTVDIDAGKLAKSKTKNPEVKKFAEQMIKDHTSVNKDTSKLLGKLKVKTEESDTSRTLRKEGEATMAKLKGLKETDFDKAYIDNEVTYHQTVLDAIDKTLMPAAQRPEIKDLLGKVRPSIEAHLQHAKQLQSSLQ